MCECSSSGVVTPALKADRISMATFLNLELCEIPKIYIVHFYFSDLMTIRDYYALVSIICNDFPYEILQKTARIVLIDDAHDCLISFTDFLYSFQIQLYYQVRR